MWLDVHVQKPTIMRTTDARLGGRFTMPLVDVSGTWMTNAISSHRSQVIERYACDNCASYYVTPYIHDLNQRTLAQDMDAFMGNGISDEDSEVLAEASAILDEEARLRAAGSLSSAGV